MIDNQTAHFGKVLDIAADAPCDKAIIRKMGQIDGGTDNPDTDSVVMKVGVNKRLEIALKVLIIATGTAARILAIKGLPTAARRLIIGRGKATGGLCTEDGRPQ